MKFKEGDKVQFISEGLLAEGVIWKVKANNRGIFYKVESDCEKNRWMWIEEGHLIPLTPLLVIPQFVADWIFEHKAFARDLLSTLDIENPAMPKSVIRWLCDNADNQELFARAWMDGYEVEKEPLYYVRFIPDNSVSYLNLRWVDKGLILNSCGQDDIYKTKFTEKEIKNMNIKYWAFAVPVEEVADYGKYTEEGFTHKERGVGMKTQDINFLNELQEAKEMVVERSTEELFDNLKEMNHDVREYTYGIQVILDELSIREKQNKEEK
ncbi:DUF1642 domain-containing protein [Listeria monocytogenes]|nr:hypothetical protein [Listeria monocytogenes]HAA8684832.1 hypothetical protein [Listeria monocytogenes]HAA8702710.1 hypothetical protein [Listeria monocytogenes]